MLSSNTKTNLASLKNESIRILSQDKSYPVYVATPKTDRSEPGIVLLHSFKGLEQGYKVMIDRLATEGFVVAAPEWQTFNQKPDDDVVKSLVSDCVDYLKNRNDVEMSKLGLTGFCAGGRFTMLLTPQMPEFKAAVPFYGFPYGKGFANQSAPVEFVKQLNVPVLIIHGTRDQASNIQDIYRYATALDFERKYFEMKIYQGQPHGFMINADGQISQSFPAEDAFWQMMTFFKRTLKEQKS
jgi:carboxymethylenebutenolidase